MKFIKEWIFGKYLIKEIKKLSPKDDELIIISIENKTVEKTRNALYSLRASKISNHFNFIIVTEGYDITTGKMFEE